MSVDGEDTPSRPDGTPSRSDGTASRSDGTASRSDGTASRPDGPPPPPPPPPRFPAPAVPPPGSSSPPPGSPPPAVPRPGSPPGAPPPRPPGAPAASQGPASRVPAPVGGQLLPVRPMSVGDVLDGAFRGLRATFVPVALVVLLLLGPLQLAFNLLLDRIAPDLVGAGLLGSFGEVDAAVGAGDVGGLLGWSTIVSVLSFLVALVAGAATVSLVLQVDRGEPGDALAAVRDGFAVFVTTIVASVLLGIGGVVALVAFALLAVVVGTTVPVAGPILAVLVFVPGAVVLGAAFFGVVNLVVPIAVVERRGPLTTIGRALWVLRLRFWRLIGITLLVGLIAVAVTLALQVPFLTLASVAGPLAWVVESLGEILGQVVSVPVTAFAALLVYLDARVRGEGLDLHLRARRLGDP